MMTMTMMMMMTTMTTIMIKRKEFLSGISLAGQDAADYLVRQVRGNGAFVYQMDASTGVISRKYNILRHGGAIYSVYQWMNLQGGRKGPDVMEKPVAHLIAHARPLEGAGGAYCIVEDNEVKLGGTALALLALTERYKFHPGRHDKVWMDRFAEFILWMQQPSGKFYSKFFYAEKQFSVFESTYYPGEAILALIRLYHIDANTRWLQAALAGTAYLVMNPVKNKQGEWGHNHWFATALAELYAVQPDKAFYEEFWRIADATILTTLSSLREGNLSSAAMATRAETVVAGLQLELREKRPERVDNLKTIARDLLTYCLNLQVGEEGPFIAAAKGGIRKHDTSGTIRIDFVQHTMQVISGLLKCAKDSIS
jgi:hypothetical protein